MWPVSAIDVDPAAAIHEGPGPTHEKVHTRCLLQSSSGAHDGVAVWQAAVDAIQTQAAATVRQPVEVDRHQGRPRGIVDGQAARDNRPRLQALPGTSQAARVDRRRLLTPPYLRRRCTMSWRRQGQRSRSPSTSSECSPTPSHAMKPVSSNNPPRARSDQTPTILGDLYVAAYPHTVNVATAKPIATIEEVVEAFGLPSTPQPQR